MSVRKRNMSYEDLKVWFYSKLIKLESGCWEWNCCRLSQGYGIIRLNGKNIRTHRLSLEFELGRKINDNMLVCHSCNNPPCCNPQHLREGTLQDNMDDKVRSNRQPKGETNGNSKLTESQVIEIKKLKDVKNGVIVAKEFGVKKACIYKIWRNEKWRHVK